ncbi:hypothetical protein CEXT_696281, partial [Caerostris extrusa]
TAKTVKDAVLMSHYDVSGKQDSTVLRYRKHSCSNFNVHKEGKVISGPLDTLTAVMNSKCSFNLSRMAYTS